MRKTCRNILIYLSENKNTKFSITNLAIKMNVNRKTIWENLKILKFCNFVLIKKKGYNKLVYLSRNGIRFVDKHKGAIDRLKKRTSLWEKNKADYKIFLREREIRKIEKSMLPFL